MSPAPSRTDLSAAILGGGRSTRMGKDKAWLELDGKPAVIALAERAHQAGISTVRIVLKRAPPLPISVPYLVDDTHEHHALHGVHRALVTSPTPFVLFIACDLVSVDVDTLRRLIDHGGAVAATAEGRVQPLLSVLSTELALRALALAQANARTMDLVIGLPRLEVPKTALQNANVPADWPLPHPDRRGASWA